jgi:hypothetical protein
MANPISRELKIGAIGELLVQIRLMQLGIQTSTPLKDSGNDLVGLKGFCFQTIQVKTTSVGNLPPWPTADNQYHLLAVVKLSGFDTTLELDKTEIFLLPKNSLSSLNRSWRSLHEFRLSQSLVDQYFS